MAFRFLHTADWQIGKRFGRFPVDRATLLGQARLEAVDRLAGAARRSGAGHVLVAGDVFDTATPELRTRRKLFERLRQHEGLIWHLLPGNHDPAMAGGLWDQCRAEGLPPNVNVHCESRPVGLVDGVWLLPSPLVSRAGSESCDWMASAATPHGALRIGLAHASVSGFGGESPRQIDPSAAEAAGLAYLALGDWHGRKQVGPRAWYSGTPEPDRFKHNDPGFALAVTLYGPLAPPEVEAVPTARYRWAEKSVRVASAAGMETLETDLRALCPDPGNLVLALDIEGLVSLADRASIARRLERLSAAVLHLEARLERLEARPEVEDLDRIDRAGELRVAAERLAALAEDGSNPRAALAKGALARLYAWAVAPETP